MADKKPPVKTKVMATKTVKAKTLTASVIDAKGKAAGTLTLPEEIFNAKINPTLMAQAVRVYLANKRQGNASTKSRGEVAGSTRKIYRQKGTGRARHGGIRAPIFVHGGIAHGPKPQDHSLTMSKKMKRASLFSALTVKLKDNEITFAKGLDQLEAKTKVMAKALQSISSSKKILFVLPKTQENGQKTTANLKRAAQNIAGIMITAADRLNTYEVLNHKTILFTDEALKSLKEHFLEKGK